MWFFKKKDKPKDDVLFEGFKKLQKENWQLKDSRAKRTDQYLKLQNNYETIEKFSVKNEQENIELKKEIGELKIAFHLVLTQLPDVKIIDGEKIINIKMK